MRRTAHFFITALALSSLAACGGGADDDMGASAAGAGVGGAAGPATSTSYSSAEEILRILEDAGLYCSGEGQSGNEKLCVELDNLPEGGGAKWKVFPGQYTDAGGYTYDEYVAEAQSSDGCEWLVGTNWALDGTEENIGPIADLIGGEPTGQDCAS